ncbi:hypothetical protein GQ53DRAFT_744117 [Thozetella sp. PMI_491]|nr:hypothetical protein GQ53DRAFT_744117 [Thozetella sp. PMI_491]
MLLCPTCTKPFASATSHRRHAAYCRKTRNRQRLRSKACQPCSIAKTKCDFQAPCQRCKDKELSCVYDRPGEQSTGPQTHSRDDVPATTGISPVGKEPSAPDGSAYSHALHPPNFRIGLEDFPTDTSFLTFDGEFPFTAEDGGLDIGLSPTVMDEHPHPANRELTSVTAVDESLADAISLLPWKISSHSPGFVLGLRHLNSIPPSLQEYPHSLRPLPISSRSSRGNARLVLQKLRAYPIMMLRRETFPPFIHPHWHNWAMSGLPGPLSSCMGIAQLFASRTAETTPFLWHTIRNETRRLYKQMNSLSGDELLAGIQAQAIYLIMRVVDEATEPSGLNFEMLRTFKLLCLRFRELDYYPPSGPSILASWERWVFAESKLRTGLVFFLLSLVVCVNADVSCAMMDVYREIPLCSGRTVWEAQTSTAWASEYSLAATQAVGHSLRNIGNLIDAQDATGNPLIVRALDNWNAHADSLGSLIGGAVGVQ